MANAKELPSGSWRCQVFAGYELIDGKKKRKYESFTASTRWEAEMLADKWSKQKNKRPEEITVSEAVDLYIRSKQNVLSPSTITGYTSVAQNIAPIGSVKLRSLSSVQVQMWISELSARLKPKTVRNAYGLFTASVALFAPDLSFHVTLPAAQRHETKFLSDEELQVLLKHVEGRELWIAIMLARYYSLRRSEICPLRSDDLVGNVLTIRRAMVRTKDGEWVTKERPKTYLSYRYLIIGEPLLSVMQQCNGRFVNCNPNSLCDRFRRALKASKVTPVSFHSLRHMFATKAAMGGVPDIATAKMGGWDPNSSTLKRIYQNVQDDDLRREMERLNQTMQHECNTKTQK